MRTHPSIAAAVVAAIVLAGACGGDDESSPTVGSSAQPTTTEDDGSTAPTEEPGETTEAPTTTTSTTAPPMATGPQTCGTVTSTVGTEVTVEIVAGDVDCAFAEDLLDTYYNAPPSPPEGSGAYVTIGDWECNSSSSQEPGRASTCRAGSDGEIVARG